MAIQYGCLNFILFIHFWWPAATFESIISFQKNWNRWFPSMRQSPQTHDDKWCTASVICNEFVLIPWPPDIRTVDLSPKWLPYTCVILHSYASMPHMPHSILYSSLSFHFGVTLINFQKLEFQILFFKLKFQNSGGGVLGFKSWSSRFYFEKLKKTFMCPPISTMILLVISSMYTEF